MDVQAIDSMVFFLMLIIFALSLYRTIRKPSEKTKFKDNMKFEKSDAERRELIDADVQTEHKAEGAETEEKQETEEAMKDIVLLQGYIRREEEFLKRIKREVKAESEKEQGGGLPGAAEIMDLCRDENLLLKRVYKTFKKTEKISRRMKAVFGSMYKKIKKSIHKVDSIERGAAAEKALSAEEIKRVKKEDHLDRVFEDKIFAISTDEKKISDELNSARRKCRTIMDLNDKIIKQEGTTDQDKDQKVRDLVKINGEENKKKLLLEHIIVSLKVISLDEEKVEELLRKSEKIAEQEKMAA